MEKSEDVRFCSTMPSHLDLHITEAVWDHLNREQHKNAVNIQRRAVNVLHEAWRTIPEYYLKKLQQGWPNTVQAVLENKDFYDKS